MNPPPSRMLTDLTWLGLMITTALAWLVFDGTVAMGSVVGALMALMFVKSVLILAVFMDLARASKTMLVGMSAFMALVAVGVVVLL